MKKITTDRGIETKYADRTMNKWLKSLLVALVVLIPVIGYVEDDISIGFIVGNGRYLGAKTADGQTTVPSLGVNANGYTEINSLSGKSVSIAVAKTPIALVDATSGVNFQVPGLGLNFGAGYVPTPAATPVGGTNLVKPGYNVVPTAAANAAMFIGAATPIPGQVFVVTNSNSANAVRLKASGGATLNGATAGGYISLAALATVTCRTQSVSNQVCEQPVIPTPAGP